jgi:hypothetical protein
VVLVNPWTVPLASSPRTTDDGQQSTDNGQQPTNNEHHFLATDCV